MSQTRQNPQKLKNITKIEKNSQKLIKINKNSQKFTKTKIVNFYLTRLTANICMNQL